MNKFTKRLLIIIVLISSSSVFSQEISSGDKAFEKFVFRNTSLSYNIENKELLVPTPKTISRESCNIEYKPRRFECSNSSGFPSKTFITIFEKPDDFNVAVFDRQAQTEDASVLVTTFVRNGKVVQQSQCFYDGQMTANGNEKKNHYRISKMKCYVVTPKLADVLLRIQSEEEFKAPKAYNEFIAVLKSPEYKKVLMEANTYNWRQAFLSLNSREDFTFEYYSKLKKGFYDHIKNGNNEKLRIVNFEESSVIKESKSLFEVFTKENALMGRVYYNPSKNLTESKLMAEIITEKK